MRLVFDGFELDPEGCQLFRNGVEVPVERRALDLLCYLATRPNRLIRKQELLEHVWHAQTLSAGVLASTLAKLRKAIAQPADARQPIETVRGRGYRFHAVAREVRDAKLDARVEARAQRADDPFVGRRYPLAQLSAALESAAGGSGQLLLIAGEAGIGKTRVVKEIEKLGRAQGFHVWGGAAYDGGVAPAYWPWVEILRAAHEQLPPALWPSVLPAGHAALAQLVPELCSSASSMGADDETLRFKLFDELTRLLKAASRHAPCLLVIDDLHWADVATIELLAYAARALEREPLLFVATVRDRDIALDPPHDEALRRVDRVATRVALQGLSNDEIAELIAALAGPQHGDARLVEALAQRTQGNPLFVRQMLGWLLQRGALCDEGALRLATADLPPALRGVIQQRLAALDEETRRVLAVSAVAGQEFDANLIAEILERPLEHVLSALEPALETRVIEHEVSMPPQRFAFTHSLVRDGLYDALGVAQQGVVHAQLARALLARGSAGDPRHVGEIARHQLLAVPSELEACVVHCRNAAALARASTGYEAAAELLSRLIQKHESEAGDPHQRAELLLTLAFDQFCAGATGVAWATLQRGAELARQLRAAPLLTRFALRLARWSQFGGGDEAYVRTILQQATRSLGDDESDLRARLLAYRAAVECELPSNERRALLHEADALAARRAAPEVLLEVAFSRVLMHDPVRFPEDPQAVARFRALDAREGVHSDPIRVHRAFFVEWVDYHNALTLCELEAAEAALARCRTLARGANTSRLDFIVSLLETGRALAHGELSAVESYVQHLREASGLGGSLGIAWLGYSIVLAYERGTLKRWLENASDFRSLLPCFPEHQRVNMQLSLAWTVAQSGNRELAAQLLAAAPPTFLERMPAQRGDLGTLCALAETYHLLADREGAARLLPRLEPFAALNAVGYASEYRGAVAHYLGLLAALLGRSAEASAYFQRAEVLNQKLQMPLQLARTQAQRALLSAARASDERCA